MKHFVMQAVNEQNVNDAKLKSAKIDGLVLRLSWRKFNPQPNSFDTGFLTAQLLRCEALGKQVILSLYTGSEAPDWIKAARFGPKAHSAPTPYAPIVLDAYDKAMESLAAHVRTLGIVPYGVEIGGPTCPDMSIEMLYKHNPERLSGYTPLKMLNAWCFCGDVVAKYFPQSLAISDGGPAPGGNNASITIGLWDYMQQRHGSQFVASDCSLKANSQKGAVRHRILRDHKAKYGIAGRIAYETIGPSVGGTDGSGGAVERFGGKFDAAYKYAEGLGCEFIKFYQSDERFLPAKKVS